MKYLVMIQARCGSTRLPNKVLADLSGKTDLQWVIERVNRSKYVDEVMTVDDNDAIRTAVEFAEKESVLIGISSGAAVYAAIEIAKTIGAGKKVLAIAPDGGEKYISMGIYG